jgi:hypothetical protein
MTSNVGNFREGQPNNTESENFNLCENCELQRADISFCNVCNCIYCAQCWEIVPPHKKKNIRHCVPHEKTDLGVARIEDVFSNDIGNEKFEQLHENDQNSAWFGAYLHYFAR